MADSKAPSAPGESARPEDGFEAKVRAMQSRLRDRMVNENRLARMDRMSLTGVRLAERDNPEAGMVVTFSEDEAAAVLAAIRSVLDARVGQE